MNLHVILDQRTSTSTYTQQMYAADFKDGYEIYCIGLSMLVGVYSTCSLHQIVECSIIRRDDPLCEPTNAVLSLALGVFLGLGIPLYLLDKQAILHRPVAQHTPIAYRQQPPCRQQILHLGR